MRAQEIRELSKEELTNKLEDLMDELANLNIQKSTHQLANPSRIKMVKRELTRVRTIMHEYNLGISEPKTATKA